jgi:Flp pilus assembly protein TadD
MVTMESAIKCPSCGVKVSADRTRCPRCRAPLGLEEPAVGAARSRRFAAVSATLAALFIVALAALWWTGRDEAPVAANPAGTSAGTPAPASAAAGVEPEFMEVAGPAPPGREDLPKAYKYYLQTVTDRPNDVDARLMLGRIQLAMNRPQEAIGSFQAATDTEPGRSVVWAQLGRAQCALSRWDECIVSLRRARDLSQDDLAVAHNLGVALHRKGAEGAAVAEFERARALGPADPAVHLGLAVSHDRLGQAEDAIEAYQEYLRLLPDTPYADKIRKRISELLASPR